MRTGAEYLGGLRDRLWSLFAIALWAIAMGWSPIGRLFNAIPPFSVTANDKLRFVALFIAAVVAARALERIRGAYIVFAMAAAAAAIYVYANRSTVLRPWDLIAPASVLLLMLIPRRFVPAVGAVLLTVDLFVLNGGFNALVQGRYYKPRLPIVEAVRQRAPAEPFRMVGLEWMFLPNASAQYGLEDIRGSDPMSYESYTSVLKPIVVYDPSIDFDRVVNVQDPLLDRLNVRYLMTEPGVEPGGRWRGVYRGADGSLFENPSAWGRFYVAEGQAEVAIERLGPSRYEVKVEAKTPVRIESSQPAGAGWEVRGAERVDGAFVGFRVGRGNHTVRVAYRPASFWASVPVALAAAVFLGWRRASRAVE